MKINISEDLSKLTTVNKQVFNKLESKIIWCISDCICESLKVGDNISDIDLGFGTLKIAFKGNEIKYKFIPSQELEKAVSNTVVNERNDLVLNIENSLVSKLTNVYKTFF